VTYVVLRHVGYGRTHFDILIDIDGGPLRSWRSFDWPPTEPPEPRPDHRRHYLTHEGQVSGNRGTVERVASGTATREGGTFVFDCGVSLSTT
jgi:hypothetical protein